MTTSGIPCSSPVASIHDLAVVLVLAVHSAGAACEEHEHCADQQGNHSYEQRPDARSIGRRASAAVVGSVDVVLEYAKQSEVACEHNDGDDPCNKGSHGCENSPAETSSESHEEGDECETAGNWVEDHNASERLCGIF